MSAYMNGWARWVPDQSYVPSPAFAAQELPTERLSKYEQQFLKNAVCIVEVEGHKFPIHTHILKRVCHDQAILDLISDYCPVSLEEMKVVRLVNTHSSVTAAQFASLTAVLFESTRPDFDISIESWINVLIASCSLHMPDIHKLAVMKIETATPPLNPIRRISLATKHNVPEWLRPAFMELIHRETPLTLPEVEMLGPERATQVFLARDGARERLISDLLAATSSSTTSISNAMKTLLQPVVLHRIVEHSLSSCAPDASLDAQAETSRGAPSPESLISGLGRAGFSVGTPSPPEWRLPSSFWDSVPVRSPSRASYPVKPGPPPPIVIPASGVASSGRSSPEVAMRSTKSPRRHRDSTRTPLSAEFTKTPTPELRTSPVIVSSQAGTSSMPPDPEEIGSPLGWSTVPAMKSSKKKKKKAHASAIA